MALVSPRRCFAEPVISAHGTAVVLDIDVGQLLAVADDITGELLALCCLVAPVHPPVYRCRPQ